MTHLKRLLGIYVALFLGLLVATVYEQIKYDTSALVPRAWINALAPAPGSEAAIMVLGLVTLVWWIAILITLYRVMAIGPTLFLAFVVVETITQAFFVGHGSFQITALLAYVYILVVGAMIYFLFFGAGKKFFENKASPAA